MLWAPHIVSIRIDPRRVFRWQCVLIAALLGLHLGVGLPALLGGHDRMLGAARLFDMRGEANLATFLSALTLVAAGMAAAVLAASDERQPRRLALTWGWLAAALLFAAFDEAAAIHEQASKVLRATVRTSGPFYFGWVLPYGLAAVVGAVLAYPAVAALGREPRRFVILGVILGIMGAMGIEMVQGVLWTARGASVGHTPLNFVLATVEEVLELLGGACLLRGLTTALHERFGEPLLRIQVGTPAR